MIIDLLPAAVLSKFEHGDEDIDKAIKDIDERKDKAIQ